MSMLAVKSRLALIALRDRPLREWVVPLLPPLLMALLVLGFWLLDLVVGPRRHGVLLGPNAVPLGLPSLYFLAWGLTAARKAAYDGRKRDAYAAAALAFGFAVLLFIALYPTPAAPAHVPGTPVRWGVPRSLVNLIGLFVGGLVTIPVMAVVISVGTATGALLSQVLILVVTFLVGLVASGAAGSVTGLGLALVESRVSGKPGRIRGHVKWMAVAAMCVYASLRIPFMPATLIVAMGGFALHAYRMPVLKVGEESRGGGTPVMLCWLVAAYAAYVAVASGPTRVGMQYIVFVP